MARRSESADEGNDTYNAFVATYRVWVRSMGELLEHEGLTQPQFHALRVMAKHGPTPMKTLSDELSVTAANITGIVDRLESKELVDRAASRKDRRATIIRLTPKGRAVHEAVAKKYATFVEGALQGFTAEEQETLRNLLAKLQGEMNRPGR